MVSNGATVTGFSAVGNAVTYTITAPAATWAASTQGTYTIALVAGGVKDLAGNGVAGNASINTFTVDTVAPAVTGVSSNTANGTYGPGAVISIQVTFSKVVTVAGVPTLALNSGGTATYAGGSGTNTLTFTYTVTAGQNSADLDYTSATALALSGGTIRDAATNNATLTLAAPGAVGSLGNAKALVVLTSRKFDMTSSTASVPDASWTSVRGNTLYTAVTGYGWTAVATEGDSATNYPAGSSASDQNLYRDFHTGGGTATFRVYVGVGRSASVKVYSYPQSAYSLGMTVSGSGAGGTTATVGSSPYVTVRGTAGADGILNVTVRGGIFGLWLVNAMEVTVL